MTKTEFMTQLHRALNGRLGSVEAAPHVEYYQQYIEIEVRGGRTEEEVIDELGSPRLIAKSIADLADRNKQGNPYGEKALEYGTQILKFGIKAGKRCAEFGLNAVDKAKVWFKQL
ncbi:MAG: DUF1700 domain-containing protein [Lachnospiraceae bacterium]|nr:DUF1700 domain-containing protein [Lachnospiraceae bacterium]